MNTKLFHASHYILRIYVHTYIRIYALSQWLYIRMSGLYSTVVYSTVVVVVMHYAHYGVWCSPKVSVWAGTNGHLLPLQYTTLFVECKLVPNMVLCALGHVH